MTTPTPWTEVRPYVTLDRDDDPMMVYIVHAGDLQERYNNIPMNEDGEYDQAVVEAIHAENAANAQLIVTAVNNHQRLMEENKVMREALLPFVKVLDAIGEVPGDWLWVQSHTDPAKNVGIKVSHLVAAKKALALADKG